MRAVFIGINPLTIATTRLLLEQGHEVVVVDADRQRIDELSAEIDCGFVHGDGTYPHILKECDPKGTDFLFCLTGHDQVNIIASLVGRSLGFARVITRIDDPEFEHICTELGLTDTVVPSRTMGRYLADLFRGHNLLAYSAMIRGEARVFSFVVGEEQAGSASALEKPDHTRLVCLYRGDHFTIPDAGTVLKPGDEVVMITRSS